MIMPAAEFKAKCLALLDRVHHRGESITITKRGDALPIEQRPYVSDISLMEVALLTGRGRVHLPIPLEEWLETAAHPRAVRVVPISPAIAARVARLEDAFRDLSDRVIVATSQTLHA